MSIYSTKGSYLGGRRFARWGSSRIRSDVEGNTPRSSGPLSHGETKENQPKEEKTQCLKK